MRIARLSSLIMDLHHSLCSCVAVDCGEKFMDCLEKLKGERLYMVFRRKAVFDGERGVYIFEHPILRNFLSLSPPPLT